MGSANRRRWREVMPARTLLPDLQHDSTQQGTTIFFSSHIMEIVVILELDQYTCSIGLCLMFVYLTRLSICSTIEEASRLLLVPLLYILLV